MSAIQIDTIYALPGKPAVYALYGGVDHPDVAYVGVTKESVGTNNPPPRRAQQ